jgi:hypothetical protein
MYDSASPESYRRTLGTQGQISRMCGEESKTVLALRNSSRRKTWSANHSAKSCLKNHVEDIMEKKHAKNCIRYKYWKRTYL